MNPTRIPRHQRLAYAIFFAGMAVSLCAWYFAASLVERQIHADFETRAQAATSTIERRAQRYIDLLHGLEGLFGHDLSVSRREFHRYVEALDLPQRFPGVQAIEYVRRVVESVKPLYETSVRADRSLHVNAYPEFAITPGGNRPEYYVVHYVEPMKGNEQAFGLDLLSREGPRRAIERARDTGEAVSTGRYRLIQEKESKAGLVIYLPVYEIARAQRTPEQRRNELAGFVNIVFRADELFVHLAETGAGKDLRFAVHDAGPVDLPAQPTSPDNLLYATGASTDAADVDGSGGLTRELHVAGRRWLIAFNRPAIYGNPYFHPLALGALIAGLMIATLVFLIMRMLSRSQEAAVRMADDATRGLRDQLSFLQQLLEALPHPVFYKDAQGRYLGCNHAFEIFSNRPRGEYIGKTALEVTTSAAAQRHHEIEQDILRNPGTRTYEMSLTRSTDGRQLDAYYTKATFVDAEGKVAGLVGVVIDISERKTLERTLGESNEKLRSLIEASPLAIIARDLNSVISLWNPAAERLFGWTAAEMVGTTNSIVPPDMRTEVNAMRRQVEKGMMLYLEETRRMRRDGSIIDVSLSVAPIHDSKQNIVGTMVLIGDISRRKQAEAALRESEAQLRLAMEAANMGSWYWDLDTGKMSFSDGYSLLFGLPRATFFTNYDEFMAAIHADDRTMIDASMRRAIKEDVNFDMECRVVWPDGSVHWLAVKGQVARGDAGRAERVVGVTTDITTRKSAEQRIAYLAHHDALTGLPNRLLLEDRIGQAIASSNRNRTRVAVLFIDLDHFKTINDSLGHQLGDELLQLVAGRIQSCLREVDTVSRLGGDEFVIVIPELAEDADLAGVAGKLLEALSTHFHLQNHDLHIGASIGISVYPADGDSAETLMRNADTAMYHAKERGRSQYQFFTGEMNAAAQHRMSLELLLRRSLQSEDFSLHYQPIFAAHGESLVGFEALLRWKNEAGATIRPAEFISVAEDSGLIVPIGEWVMREACRTAADWRRRGLELRLAINVSALQLRRKSFVDTVRDILEETGADARQIEMEITERVIVGGHEDAVIALRALDALGIRIAIDDFGTGYSGLSYLKQFPIDTVKIDQSFVRDLTVDADDEAIVRAIIAMSQSLKLDIVAEGVEHEEQLKRLRELGCDMAQGYYFSRPMPATELDAYIAAHLDTARRRQA